MTSASRNVTLVPLLLLLLAACSTAFPTQQQPQAVMLPRLPTAMRDATTDDIRQPYTLMENFTRGDGTFACPGLVNHTTWKRNEDSVIILPHNTILHNVSRCSSRGDEKRLELYDSKNYSTDGTYTPLDTSTPPLPDDLKARLFDGLNDKVVNANRGADSSFLVGWEAKTRQCGSDSSFTGNTVLFLMRPSTDFTVPNVDLLFETDGRYMIVVPAFAKTYCVYAGASVVDTTSGFDEDETSPSNEDDGVGVSDSPLPSDDDMDPSSSPSTETEDSTSPADGESPASEEPNASDEDDDGVCFPADAVVSLGNGSVKRMEHLRVGDMVRTGVDSFSPVFGFTHAAAGKWARFLTLRTRDGHALTVTPGHYVYVATAASPLSLSLSTAKMARDVRVGDDALVLADGSTSRVTHVSSAFKVGVYNPQTMHGAIVANGVLATTFTKEVRPAVAHAMMAPLRALHAVCGVDVLSAWVQNESVRTLRHLLPSGLSSAF